MRQCPYSATVGTSSSTVILVRFVRPTSPSPEQLQAELDLARRGGRAGNCASRWRNARGSEDYGIGQVEIRSVKKVEYLRPKLKIQPLANPCVFQHGEIPRTQPRSDQRVSSDISIESTVCR